MSTTVALFHPSIIMMRGLMIRYTGDATEYHNMWEQDDNGIWKHSLIAKYDAIRIIKNALNKGFYNLYCNHDKLRSSWSR